MNEMVAAKAHWSFWAIVVFALLWNIGGSINYLMQADPTFVAGLPETHRAIIEGRPSWATGGFAVGVFGGVLGCLLLLFKRHISLYLFMASLAGIAVTMLHTINVANSPVVFTTGELVVMIALPLIVAAFLIWYTAFTRRKGWIY